MWEENNSTCAGVDDQKRCSLIEREWLATVKYQFQYDVNYHYTYEVQATQNATSVFLKLAYVKRSTQFKVQVNKYSAKDQHLSFLSGLNEAVVLEITVSK